MKQNLVVLLADLFNLFEIHPAKCVAYPGMDQQISSKHHRTLLKFVDIIFIFVIDFRFSDSLICLRDILI